MKFNLSAINSTNIKKGISYIRENGLDGIASRVRYKMQGPGLGYNVWYRDNHEASHEELEFQRNTDFSYKPLISILVPIYETPERYLRDMIESVVNQTYSNWQLIIVDGSKRTEGQPHTETIVREYMEEHRKIVYAPLEKNFGIAMNTNMAFNYSTGEYITLLDHDDMLTPDALFSVVKALQEEKYDVLYSDEDKIAEDGSRVSDPAFKPDFSIDLLRAHNYITHLFVVKRKLLLDVGGFDSEYDGAQDYDLALKCSEKTKSIKHIPRVLYHWRINDKSVALNPHKKEYAKEAGKRALQAHIERCGCYATVTHTDMWGMYKVNYETPGNPLLSIVIPGGNNREIIEKCIGPLFEKTRYSDFELIIVNPHTDDNVLQKFYARLEATRKNIRVLEYDGTPAVIHMRNYGASKAKGDYILFLDYGVEKIEVTAVKEMLGHCMRKEVGVVGGALFADNGATISQGIAVGVNGPFCHLYKGIKKGDFGYLMHNHVNANFSAVSGSCMMVKTELFRGIGGFSEKFVTEFSDVDFCLRIREHGYLIVGVADATWHFYSATNTKRDDYKTYFEREKGLFEILWSNIITNGDPYYNPNFTRNGDYHDIK